MSLINRIFFFKAVRKAGLNQFYLLNQDQKNKVYGFVYELAGKPKTNNDLQWGESNAFNNLPRLFDAMNLLQSEKAHQ